MSEVNVAFGLDILQVIWINILLSGDNAVVIAMACRSLPERQRRWGIVLGAGAGVVLRIAFSASLFFLLEIPHLKSICGLLLLWIAVRILSPEGEVDRNKPGSAETLLRAIATVAVADVVMSLDNVIGTVAAADGSLPILAFGVAVSIPVIVAGSKLILALFDRFPFIIWAGAALLGWFSGQLIADEPFLHGLLTLPENAVVIACSLLGATIVLVAGLTLRLRSRFA